MRAIVYRRYGPPAVLEPADVDRPVAGPGQVVVAVRAVAINPYDLHFLRGDPYVMRPALGLGIRRPRRPTILGSDIAGVVESIGPDVTRFKPGDEVYGTAGMGGLAEAAAVAAKDLAAKPVSLSFEQAAAVPMAGYTALQSLRDFGRLEAGQAVLVNGASGGVGSFAVQLARALGAGSVTGVCSAANLDLVRSLGAAEAIDYGERDFTREGRRYDLIVDTAGNHGARAMCRALRPDGTLVIVGAGGGRLFGPVTQIVFAKLASRFVRQRVETVMARRSADDLAFLAGLIDSGAVTPVVGRVYPFSEAARALADLETRHARGKLVISVSGGAAS